MKQIPRKVIIGDSYTLEHGYIDYINQGYTLYFSIIGLSEITVSTVNDTVTIPASETLKLTQGSNKVWIYGVKDDERTTLCTYIIEVLPDPSSLELKDFRSHAKKMLDALEACIEKRATANQLGYITRSLTDMSLTTMTDDELYKLRNKFKFEYLTEQGRLPKTIKLFT